MLTAMELAAYLGDDPGRPGLEGTPERWLTAYRQMCSGYDEDPREILCDMPEAYQVEPIVMRGILFESVCEQHLLPFAGMVDLAYIPGEAVAPVSSVVDVVECYAKRIQSDERIARQVADVLIDCLTADGAWVIVTTNSACSGCRAAQQMQVAKMTQATRGEYKLASARATVARLIGV